jgi:ornithine cyclodeaminase/alanine dehydrogenase-like protein (mu-crystallin family)
VLYDLDPGRAAKASAALRKALGVEATVAQSLGLVLGGCSLVSFATTAAEPHVADLSSCPRGATILHVSLRDLAPQAILSCDNVVDDADHLCRAQTSVHLAEQQTGSRAFIRCTLADILSGAAAPRRDAESTVVFSPFGLGVLDLAVGKLVRDLALAAGRGRAIPSFQPTPET